MISKKDAVMLGMLAIGGVGAAMVISGDDAGDAMTGRQARAGGILGAGPSAPTIYQVAAQPAVTFPGPPTFNISKMFPAPSEPKPDPVVEYYKERKGTGYMPRPWEVRKILARKEISKKPAKKEMGFAPEPTYISGVGYGVGVYPKPPVYAEEITHLPAARLPAAIGVSTALKYARGASGVSAAPTKKEEIK